MSILEVEGLEEKQLIVSFFYRQDLARAEDAENKLAELSNAARRAWRL